jgi:hypothetical protein
MNEEMTELAKRAVASPHFRPMLGMSDGDEVITRIYDDGDVRTSALVERSYDYFVFEEPWSGTFAALLRRYWLPDLTDPATLGCLHDLACAALGADVIDICADVIDICADHAPDMGLAWWMARDLRGRHVASGRVESLPLRAAGYVAALEAAPASGQLFDALADNEKER